MSLKALFYPKGTVESPIKFEELFIPHIYREIYLEGVYADAFKQKSDMVVIDIGANIGIVTQYMRDYAKKIYAIEPSIDSFEALKKNKEFNSWDNVEIFNHAIGDRDGELMLNAYASNRTMYSLTTEYRQGGEMVKTVTMDTFFKENNIEEVDFLKMDVEGGEHIILPSPGFIAVADRIKTMEIEFHYPNWGELVEQMKNLGYQFKRIESSAILVLFTR